MAFILTQIIKKKLPQWNSQVFTEADFYVICTEQKLRVMESEKFKYKGEYSIHKGLPFILLNKKLSQPEKIWIGFHELGHHFLHYPIPKHHFAKTLWNKFDREANYFASIALIPTFIVESKSAGEIIEEFNYSKELIKIRKEIYDNYKI
jgi:Zn-dependent peptidase ImmA (M78 family)